jgi:methylated-DNA-[protein]-cysteine S-methyltransferase
MNPPAATIFATVFATAAGTCGIVWRGDGAIVRFHLPRPAAEATRAIARRFEGEIVSDPPEPVGVVIAAVRAYFDGTPTDFGDAALDPGAPDDFQDRVYAHVRRIRWGETTTYGAVATALGAPPEAAREVGRAMARNPLPLLVPCHRVLAAGGRIGGFSAPGGAATKLRMLALEGIDLAPPLPAQGSLAF